MVKFSTNTSGTTYNWPNLEPTQVAFYLAGEIAQVKDSIPWVRCASGNVLWTPSLIECFLMEADNLLSLDANTRRVKVWTVLAYLAIE